MRPRVQVSFRPLPIWPFPATPEWERRSSRIFRASWDDTVELLKSEVEHLGADRFVIMAGFQDDEIRLDGMPRATARKPAHPGVIVTFESRLGPLSYPTDTADSWQANVRGIALALGALRAVDRYGVTKRGEQYVGWKQLTAGSTVTSHDQAAELIGRLAAVPVGELREPDLARAYRAALKKAHPDGGGNAELFAAVQDAGRILGLKERSSHA